MFHFCARVLSLRMLKCEQNPVVYHYIIILCHIILPYGAYMHIRVDTGMHVYMYPGFPAR